MSKFEQLHTGNPKNGKNGKKIDAKPLSLANLLILNGFSCLSGFLTNLLRGAILVGFGGFSHVYPQAYPQDLLITLNWSERVQVLLQLQRKFVIIGTPDWEYKDVECDETRKRCDFI